MKAWRKAVGLALLVLAGCSSAPVPEDSFYRVGDLPEPGLVFDQYPIDGRLLVELPRAAGIRRQRGILYSEDPDHVELRRYHYHYWEDAPPEMLQRRLIERLRDAEVAPTITERMTTRVDSRLQTRLRRFERDVDGSSAHAVVTVDFVLFDGSGQGDALFRGSYTRRVPADSMRMIDTARAFTRAVDGVIDEFLAQLAEST